MGLKYTERQWAKPESNWAQGVAGRPSSGAKHGESLSECFSLHGKEYSAGPRWLQEDPWLADRPLGSLSAPFGKLTDLLLL
jgi:hypothetical protein